MNWEDHVRVSYDDNSELQKYFCVLNVQIYIHNHSVISLSFLTFLANCLQALMTSQIRKILLIEKVILSKNKIF